jgi:hypothetical protein
MAGYTIASVISMRDYYDLVNNDLIGAPFSTAALSLAQTGATRRSELLDRTSGHDPPR